MHRVRAPRVLIVADEPALLRLLGRLLQQDGYSVGTVDPAGADFFALGQEDPPYDIVVVNSFLPDLSGNEAAEQIGALFPRATVLHVDDESHGPFSLDRLLDRVHDVAGAATGGAVRSHQGGSGSSNE
jgi:DNA-binding NtrC family response regulator